MTAEKQKAEDFCSVLNQVEEALAALDQAAGRGTDVQFACRKAYDAVKKALECEAEAWNYEEPVKVFRCSKATKPYHTAADGPCEVWSLNSICDTHQRLAEEHMHTGV